MIPHFRSGLRPRPAFCTLYLAPHVHTPHMAGAVGFLIIAFVWFVWCQLACTDGTPRDARI
ncbi:hypothetical protein BD311DRAFT_752707 [Dichomitus squalens]|uniref:Uncharacterized protein n=1 Tax=Dichomitus squalens TaxID=114155 RepID=A0A4V2K158_9APHY|nr:hypothetical protein BD311DRAFT_752707 [Dichomitus squalens]